MTQTSSASIIDFFNATGQSNITVGNILTSLVANANESLAPAYS